MQHKRALAVTRIGLSVGGVLLMSVQCGAPLGGETLHRFETCDDLETYLQDQVLHPRVETRAGSGAGPVLGCSDEAISTAPGDVSREAGGDVVSAEQGAANGAESTNAMDDSGVQPPVSGGLPDDREFTETNTQEEAVDEADFVKSDGEHLYVLRRGEMIIVDAWPAAEMQVRSRTPIVGQAFAMFFDEGRALVAASDFSETVRAAFGPSVVLQLFDVEDPRAPVLLRETRVDGSYVDARRVGDEVLVVTRTQMSWPWIDQSAPFMDDKNRALLEAHGLRNALPGVRDVDVEANTTLREGLAFQCHNTFAPESSDGQNLVVVHTYSMSEPNAPLKSTGVVGNPDFIYASEESVYLADTLWHDGGYFTPEYAETRFHKLRAFTEGDGAAEYRATGTLPGRLHNQFSLDEEDGRLRAVLTTNDSLDGAADNNRTSLVVLEEQELSLVEVGRVDNIGDGELVQAVRFLGDFAYVVTYPLEGGELSVPPSWRIPPAPAGGVWDPLFVIDLSDPRSPRLRGELEVAGYSTYIHPLGDDHILTIGVDSDERGTVLGMALSVFDVENPDAPSLAQRETFGDGLSFSEALTDHHAFTFFPARAALGIPIQLTDDAGRVTSTGLEVFHVDAEQGIERMGGVEQLALFDGQPLEGWNAGCAVVRRSVMIAEGEQAYVYALSTGGITVSSLEDGVPTVSELPLWVEGDAICPAGTPL